jgi:hypothetical protein
MEEGSSTIALTTPTRKRSISAHRHPTSDSQCRTSIIKTKIQKIDGQYIVSPTCPVINQPIHNNDDPDEPLIVATFPPFIQNNSKYRSRQDIYDDEARDDQHSNSSSLDDSPLHESMSSVPVQSSAMFSQLDVHTAMSTSEHRNQSSTDSSVKQSSCASREINVNERPLTIDESTPIRKKLPKKPMINRSDVSIGSSAISLESTKIK